MKANEEDVGSIKHGTSPIFNNCNNKKKVTGLPLWTGKILIIYRGDCIFFVKLFFVVVVVLDVFQYVDALKNAERWRKDMGDVYVAKNNREGDGEKDDDEMTPEDILESCGLEQLSKKICQWDMF